MAVRIQFFLLNFQYTYKLCRQKSKRKKKILVPRGDAMNTDQENRYHIFHKLSQILKGDLIPKFLIIKIEVDSTTKL